VVASAIVNGTFNNLAMVSASQRLSDLRAEAGARARSLVEQTLYFDFSGGNFMILRPGTGFVGPDVPAQPGFGGIHGPGSGTGTGYGYGYGYSFQQDPLYQSYMSQAFRYDPVFQQDLLFDLMILENPTIPETLRVEVRRRMALAFFRGAYDAKYTTGSFGQGYWGSGGTGNGYFYGSGTGSTGTGNGWSTGPRREPLAWNDTGTGSGTGGTGSGSGPGAGTGPGTGRLSMALGSPFGPKGTGWATST